MGQELHALRGVIAGDNSSWLHAVGQAINASRDFGRQWTQVVGEVVQVSGRIAASVTGIATAMGTAVGYTGGKFNSLKENAQIAFSTILKDGEKAKSFLADLQKFSAETPFTFGGLIKNSQFLLASGFKLSEIIPALRVLGDAMSGLGKGEDSLQSVALALSQIRSGAKLSAQDMMQLVNQGIPAWQILADAIGKTVGETRKLSEQGAFTGEQAYGILMGGLQQRFGGGMAAAAGSFDQLLSNLKDTFDIRSGEITAPLFDSLKNVFRRFLDYLNSGEFNGVVAGLTNQFATAGQAIEQFLGRNQEAIVRGITDALSGLAQGVANLVAWAQRSGPSIQAFLTGLHSIVARIGEFVAQYPQALVALALWNGAQMLGAIGLLKSFGTLLSTGASLLWSFIGALRASHAASAASSSGFIQVHNAANLLKGALAAGAAAAIVAGFFVVLQNASAELRKELEANRKELEAIRGMSGKAVDAEVNAAMQQGSPEKRANHLRVAQIQAEEEARKAAQDVANRRLEKGQIEKNMTVGDKISRLLPEGIGGFDPAAEAARDLEAAEARWTEAQQRIADIKRQIAEQEKLAAEGAPGALGEAGGPMGGLPAIDLNPTAEGDAADKAAAKAQAAGERAAEQAVEAWSRRADEVTFKMESMADRLVDLQGRLSPEQIQAFADQMQLVSDQYMDGNLTAREYQTAIKRLDAAMAEATEQAEAEARAEERKRLLRGDFTQEEFRTALEDKIISMQRQRLQQMVDNAANQWGRMNGFVDESAGRFVQLGGYMNDFGQGVQQATGYLNGFGRNGGGLDLGALFASPQANMAMLFNEMQQLKQILSLPGVSMDRKAQVQGRIDEISGMLNAPPPPPMFLGLTGNGEITDPGLQSQSATGRSMSININVPNLTRVSQSEANMLVAAIQNEMQRQGRRL